LSGLGLDPDKFRQNDVATWPTMRTQFEAIFKTRTRDNWAALFADTDACVSPVLTLAEAPTHPHNVARGSFVNREGVTQASPAPKFSPDASIIREPETSDLTAILTRWQSQ
jgi:alpha-methylacyl-CoA racemase